MRIDSKLVVKLYTVEHLTMREIGRKLGCSACWVAKLLKSENVPARNGEIVRLKCDQCQCEYEIHRCRWRATMRHFCSSSCYFAALSNPDLVMHRHSSRKARKLVEQWFPLLPEHRVHHVDSNQRNNAIGNLWVFKSASDHAAFERGRPVEPIWKGPVKKAKPTQPGNPILMP